MAMSAILGRVDIVNFGILHVPDGRVAAFDFSDEPDTDTWYEIKGKDGHYLFDDDTTSGWNIGAANFTTTGAFAVGDVTMTGDLEVGPVGARLFQVTGASGDVRVGAALGPVATIDGATGAVACAGDLSVGAIGAATATIAAATGAAGFDGDVTGSTFTSATGAGVPTIGTCYTNPVAEWRAGTCGVPSCPASQTDVVLYCYASVPVGSKITGAKAYYKCTEAAALTLDIRIVKVKMSTGALTAPTATTGFAQVTSTQADATQSWSLDADEVVADAYLYGVEMKATTGVGDTIDGCQCELVVEHKI